MICYSVVKKFLKKFAVWRKIGWKFVLLFTMEIEDEIDLKDEPYEMESDGDDREEEVEDSEVDPLSASRESVENPDLIQNPPEKTVENPMEDVENPNHREEKNPPNFADFPETSEQNCEKQNANFSQEESEIMNFEDSEKNGEENSTPIREEIWKPDENQTASKFNQAKVQNASNEMEEVEEEEEEETVAVIPSTSKSNPSSSNVVHVDVDVEREEFPCHLCTRRFLTSYTLKGHLETEHLDQKLSNCIENVRLACVHVNMDHLELEGYQCPICQSFFSSLHHTEQHTENKHCVEPVDPPSPPSSVQLKPVLPDTKWPFNPPPIRAVKLAGNPAEQHPVDPFEEPVYPMLDGSKHRCEVCLKGFDTKMDLDRHIDTKHVGLMSWTCRECGYRFFQDNKFKEHLRRHEQKNVSKNAPQIQINYLLKCEYCPKKCSNEIEMDQHMYTVHMRKHAFVCQWCGKGMDKKSTLNYHCKNFCRVLKKLKVDNSDMAEKAVVKMQ